MAPRNKVINENIVDTSSAGGAGAILPDPVNTGDAHANRPQDNMQSDAAVAHVSGQDIPRSQMINAIIAKLVGLDNTELAQILGADLDDDATAPGVAASAVGGTQAGNLASISTKEDVEELFSGENLTEEFKTKVSTIFEAAVQARVAVERVAIEEKAEEDVQSAIEGVTEELVGQIDKYLTFAAEQFIEDNKKQLEVATRNSIAEQFVDAVLDIAQRFKIESDPIVAEANKGLEDKITALETQINEALDREVELTNKLKEATKKEILHDVAESLSMLQRDRYNKLAETVEYANPDDFRAKLAIIKESVGKKDTPVSPAPTIIMEAARDGVPAAEPGAIKPAISRDVKAALGVLARHKFS